MSHINIDEDIFTVAIADIYEKRKENEVITVIRFPPSLGITGLACKEHSMIALENVSTTHDIRFNGDVDNFLSVYNLRNILVSEFSNEENKARNIPIGVL